MLEFVIDTYAGVNSNAAWFIFTSGYPFIAIIIFLTPIVPEALKLPYCPFLIIDIFPAILTDISIIPERLILYIGTAFENAARSIRPTIEALKSGSLIGVLRLSVISKGLPASSM